jgi:hypothetical protein
MKKITKAVFSFGQQSPAAIGLTSTNPMLAGTENGRCNFSFAVSKRIMGSRKI